MDNSLKPCSWEEIHGFISPGEYARFIDYIERQVALSQAEEVPVDYEYCDGEICGGRWFKDADSGQVWRLIAPDFPFRGLWEPVKLRA